MAVKVTFNLYGVYTHGSKAGEVNPAAKATARYEGKDVKEAVKRMTIDTDGAFYTIHHVEG